jgi:threonine dehydrogenase-like Zn-dependent dehydrogenase
VARAAVAQGRADFVALGRTLLADPDWARKVRAGRPIRRCLACNTCINEMRGGNRIRCVVNPVTGRERRFGDYAGPKGERIAVIGAGPAGLSYASLVAPHNTVTVFERRAEAGGAFNLAGLAPVFQEVDAATTTFARYVTDLEAECRRQGVTVRFGADPAREPSLLDGFDRVVIATGASYRWGLGAAVPVLLRHGAGRSRFMRRLFGRRAVRDWFYHGARRATAERVARAARPGQTVVAIGDARVPGKSRPAIASAFAAALLGDPGADLGPDRIPAAAVETDG